MLDKIKAQFESANVLSKNQFYQMPNRETSMFIGELFPLALDYFHELNPGFLFKIPKVDFLNQYHAVCVRDGSASFGAFILNNFQTIRNLNTHFIIHPQLAPLVPDNLKKSFSCWEIVQKKKSEITEAKRILIAGLITNRVSPQLKEIKKKLESLKGISSSCEIDVFLPSRRNSSSINLQENYLGFQIVEVIKTLFPLKKLNFLTSKDLLERSDWKDIFCLDLTDDLQLISDNYVNHFIVSRGGVTSAFNDVESSHSVFEIDLSLNHKVLFSPLPSVKSIFPEMIFYKKQTTTTDFASDPVFQALLRKKNF